MGRIKKAAGPKHEATVSAAITEFVATAAVLPISQLPEHLQSFPRRWPFPRGDLYHWIPLLNRFDLILEDFNREYGLQEGPQRKPFTRALLERGVVEENKPYTGIQTSQDELDDLGHAYDGDKGLVVEVLTFSRELMDRCGNRSLYSSSDRLNDLLNTTDLSLLVCALQLARRLAQRYYASRQRGANASQSLNNALLASHYNIDLEKVQKLANPFSKPSSLKAPLSSETPTLQVTKDKGKRRSSYSNSFSQVHPNDLLAMATDEAVTANGSASKSPRKQSESSQWAEWGTIQLRYYQTPAVPRDDTQEASPTTPTPTRRPLRPSRLSGSDEVVENPMIPTAAKVEEQVGMKVIEIPHHIARVTPTTEILKEALGDLPKHSQYDFLTRARISQAMSASLETRRELLKVRLLAVTNLAHIYPEQTFQQKILQQDSDEPRRLQLTYQLADLIHPPRNGKAGIPSGLQAIALGTLEALIKHKARASDVCVALNINVNHGILLHTLKKAVADMSIEDSENDNLDLDEWHEALFSLLDALPTSSPRTGEALIAAGLFDILIEVLNLRTRKAERYYPKVLTFLNTIVYTVRDALQTLANAKGLDAISNLTAFEVQSSLQRSKAGQGISLGYRTQATDYQIPYFQQQTLRWLFKFVNHMMSHSGGNVDRLLRNLIDSPHLLGALRTVIVNAKTFGSNVWSGAVNILSSFIHNEPTSYNIIAEAGLSRGFLESVSSQPITDPTVSTSETAQAASSADQGSPVPKDTSISNESMQAQLPAEKKDHLAEGILPATDAIVTIPQAFGAICLNVAGMELFRNSKALESFFEIFQSPEHVKSMTVEAELPRLLGSSFDELVRHHPLLKMPVMLAILGMIRGLASFCKSRAANGQGAKLWVDSDVGGIEVAGGPSALRGEISEISRPPSAVLISDYEGDVLMSDALRSSQDQMPPHPTSSEISQAIVKSEELSSTYISVAMKFLAGFFENTHECSTFVEQGGLEYVLDLVELPSLQHDFNNQGASQEIARVVHMLAEQKPHLVVPSVVKRTQKAADVLEPFCNHNDGTAYFANYTTPNQSIPMDSEFRANGTRIVKSLVTVHTFCNILYETFSPPLYNSRSSPTLFTQVNLTDIYITLVKSLGRLHRVCVWEEILLQNSMPEKWKESTKVRGFGMGSQEADDIFGLISREEVTSEMDEGTRNVTNGTGEDTEDSNSRSRSSSSKKRRQSSIRRDENTAQFQNVRTLRYLLSQIPSSIVPFFQGLGKALIAKRRPETYARQNAYMVAEAISVATLEQLRFEAPKATASAKDRYSYLIVILTSISQLMIEGPRESPHPQCLTLVLQAFKNAGGLVEIKELLETFFHEVKELSNLTQNSDVVDVAARLATAYGGVKIVLNFFTQIVSVQTIIDSNQTTSLSANDSAGGQPYNFWPPQFLVELRMAVLPVVRFIWESDFVDKASSSIVKCLVEILRIGLESNGEQDAYKRGGEVPVRAKPSFRIFNIQEDRLNSLTGQGYDVNLAREALYRCGNHPQHAEEYCRARKNLINMPRVPIPSYDEEKPKTPSPALSRQREDSDATIPDSEHAGPSDSGASQTETERRAESLLQLMAPGESSERNSPRPPPPAPGVPEAGILGSLMDATLGNMTEITDITGGDLLTPRQLSGSDQTTPSPSLQNLVPATNLPDVVTVDDLDNERTVIRHNLIDRALDVLNVHDDVTFELADLIHAATLTAPESATMRREIVETLLPSLISQVEDDFRTSGKKIAAYANLLGLVLQDDDFYQATSDELRSNFSQLLGFIKILPDQRAEETSPWIGQILLILEKILAEDVQPSKVEWTTPSLDTSSLDVPLVVLEGPILPVEEKVQLFEKLVEIMPKIGKDERLALAVVRMLVLLTRNSQIAKCLAEKRNIQRLFVMVKQLAGVTNEHLQSSFMLVLRHIVEDDDTIRQIMRSEIVHNFESRLARSPTDTTGYVRQMYHLVLRSPEIFIEVTNDVVEIKTYDPNPRPQILTLKPAKGENADSADTEHADRDSAGSLMEIGKAASTEEDQEAQHRAKGSEVKAPAVENPSGVIHYILCELLSYKDVLEKESTPTIRSTLLESQELSGGESSSSVAGSSFPRNADAQGLLLLAELATSESSSGSANLDTGPTKKAEKPEFKAEQHPIHVYRCFLLQCLTELLNSYNRTKIEFINFSRKADPQAMTPSKPRSGILNYLLNDLVPVGSLNHDETINARKKSTLSDWAMSTIVSLCLKTNENGQDKKRGSLDEDEEPDLFFVRKFVLEHALKAYKDATTSEEVLDVKYSRLLCLADLFERLLQGKLGHVSAVPPSVVNTGSQKQLAKAMFEKNFITALTSSIAEIDLNFPLSRRAVKYILKPMKELTSTGTILSETSKISSTPGQTDEDEISTASSVSDLGDDREETPDLFRNSTLGMFEPGREDESSSESSDDDEEMYDDEYDEGLEYDEEIGRDGGEVISDEEEELEGAGHIEGMPADTAMDVEVVIDEDEGEPSGEEVDDDDDGQDDSEDMDDDEALEAIDEITGEGNNSMDDAEEEEWQDEDDGGDEDGYDSVDNDMGPQVVPEEGNETGGVVQEIIREFASAGDALNALEEGRASFDTNVEGEDYQDAEGIQEEDDDPEEDDDEDGEDEELVYQPDYADDEPAIPAPPWLWDTEDDTGGMPPPRHHHHHPRRIPSPWTIFPAGHQGDRGPIYRSHRPHHPSGATRTPDDGTNPLLQRNGHTSGLSNAGRAGRSGLSDAAASMSDIWLPGMEPGPQIRGGPLSAESPVSFVNNIIAAISQHGHGGLATITGQPGAVHLHIGGGPGGGRSSLPRELQALLGFRNQPPELSRPQRDNSTQAIVFLPLATLVRWQEEARLLFGNAHAEKAQRIVNSLLRVLVPPAIEQKKRRDEEERLEREASLKAAEERRAREEREKTEKEAQEKKEQEEREAAAAAEAERVANAQGEQEPAGHENEEGEEFMEGVEATHTEQSTLETDEQGGISISAEQSAATNSSAPTERVRTTFRGRDLDITGMGVDLEYLEALPEDLREEVLVHQIAVQRSQAVSSGEEPTDISREFLEALPPEIRQELLEQEAQDRRRREREEERRRRTAESGVPPRAEEMDPASFLASLDPHLRQAVLMEQDDEVLAQLPSAIAAEARALGGDRGFHHTHRGFAGIPGHPRSRLTHERERREPQQARQKPPHRQIIQMIDKSGVATLLRLMFVQQQGSSRVCLNGILHDVSRNRHTRAEVVSLLLSILQDGSTDISAVERSFAHLSLRAKQPSTQKTPQPLKRSLTGSIISLSNSEMTPLMVIQQCLNALVYLTHYNPHIPSFFLTEHEISSGMKSKTSRKGKAKETKAQKFALNALLSLLDRKLIMESSSCMEQLSTLLQRVTHPLTMLLRKEKEKEGSPKAHGETQPTTESTIAGEETQIVRSEIRQNSDIPIENSTVVPDPSAEAPSAEELPRSESTRTNEASAPEDKPDDEKSDKGKKARTLTPPVVPEENLRLVVNILAARECSAKTFRETLSTINNLSAIPEARDVFGKGLIEQAQSLGQSILSDLDELVPQIQQAESGADVQAMALAKFSPASSDQAKLLRVLTALDYLFDPKRNNGRTKSAAEKNGDSSLPKEDIVTSLYENPIFSSLWAKLSECLSTLRHGEGMLNIATILLPLIEALMVVCKNTTLKDAPLVKAAKEFSITSPPPESRMENLFFRFTEDHRKVLNDLVRHNPKLMSGTFSLLVKNPKVLEFDNKRNYFNRRLHSRGTEIRNPQGPLQLNVRRDLVFLDSYKSMHFKSGDEVKYGKLNIRFQGEEGVDAGGVTREWFQVLSRQMFNPDYALFVPVASDRTTFHPNKSSKVNEEHLDFFKFIGRIIGKALYEGRALDCHFSRAVYKRILGKSVSIKDMETLDLDYYKSLLWMLENDINEIITETFSVETDDFGVTNIVDLVDNGRNVPVTEDNKQEYVQLVVEYRLTGSVQAQLEKFLQGFHDIVPAELISIFNEQELELLISGLPDIDIDDWKNNTDYHNYVASSMQIQWFWRAVRSFDKEERAKLLQFVTGTSKVPLNGFGQLEGMNGFSRFNIHRDYGNKDRLPSSHTCFNQLDLPEYDSYEQLRQQVYTAMTAGSEYFGFA